MTEHQYRVAVEPLADEEGGGFLASVPDLPGCMSDGETPAEALANVQDAITAWMEGANDMGRQVPGAGHSGEAAREAWGPAP